MDETDHTPDYSVTIELNGKYALSKPVREGELRQVLEVLVDGQDDLTDMRVSLGLAEQLLRMMPEELQQRARARMQAQLDAQAHDHARDELHRQLTASHEALLARLMHAVHVGIEYLTEQEQAQAAAIPDDVEMALYVVSTANLKRTESKERGIMTPRQATYYQRRIQESRRRHAFRKYAEQAFELLRGKVYETVGKASPVAFVMQYARDLALAEERFAKDEP